MPNMRTQRTKREIFRAITTLLKKDVFKKITVNMIAEEAMIHRNTFYLYYNDKYDLIEAYINEKIVFNLDSSDDVLSHPFLKIMDIYQRSFSDIFAIQKYDEDFNEAVSRTFTRIFVENIGNNYQKYFLLGRLSAVIAWVEQTNQPYTLFTDGEILDQIYTDQKFPD